MGVKKKEGPLNAFENLSLPQVRRIQSGTHTLQKIPRIFVRMGPELPRTSYFLRVAGTFKKIF